MGSKKILLLRHAKSSWKHPDLSDHDRPLNKRGRAAAPVIGAWLRQNGHVPDLILSSTSVRTRQTIESLNLPAEPAIHVEFLPELYHAAPEALLTALRSASDTSNCVMIVGHQPGLSSFAGMFSERAERHCVQAYEHFPTAAVAVFQTDTANWSDLGFCSAVFTDFVKPRDLIDG